MEQISLKDFRLAFPTDGAQWLDLFNGFTIPANTVVPVPLITCRMPAMAYGRLSAIGVGVRSGNSALVGMFVRYQDTVLPRTIGGTVGTVNPANINNTNPFALSQIYESLESGGELKVSGKNTSAVQAAVVWVRVQGWYYSR